MKFLLSIMAAGLATALLLSFYALKTGGVVAPGQHEHGGLEIVAAPIQEVEADICIYLRDEVEQAEELVALPIDINAATDVQPYESDRVLLEQWVSRLGDNEGLDPSLASMETWKLCQDYMGLTRLAITYQNRELLRYKNAEASIPLQVELTDEYPEVYASLTYESLDAIDNFSTDVWNQVIKFGSTAAELDNVPSQETLRLALVQDRLKAFIALIEQMRGL